MATSMRILLGLLVLVGFNAYAEHQEGHKGIKFSGDFRFRTEFVHFDKSENKPEVNRQRLRARFKAQGHVSDSIKVALVLASGDTGTGGITSTNQTLEDSLSNKPIQIDMAYFDWQACRDDRLHVFGGKMKNSFFRPGKSDLIWDGDLTPEGLAANYKFGHGFVNLAQHWIAENHSSGNELDPKLLGAQIGGKFDIGGAAVIIGASYFDHTHLQGMPAVDGGTGKGNSLTGGNYDAEFKLTEGFLQVRFGEGAWPVTVYADYVTNGGDKADANDRNTGYMAGIKAGSTKKPKQWSINYNFRRLEEDAVVGAFTDGDFGNGGTDAEGHKLSVAYAPVQNAVLAASYFDDKRGLGKGVKSTDYDRTQIDFIFKF